MKDKYHAIFTFVKVCTQFQCSRSLQTTRKYLYLSSAYNRKPCHILQTKSPQDVSVNELILSFLPIKLRLKLSAAWLYFE